MLGLSRGSGGGSYLMPPGGYRGAFQFNHLWWTGGSGGG